MYLYPPNCGPQGLPSAEPMKRSISDLDQSSSDGEDIFDDKGSSSMPTTGDNCQMHNRKKRRGMIEKRRRDRINNSLNELRRLVPAAFEKQGSAKLEKAEILQMTVDHLRMLHAKGFDAFSFDPHKFAMDYHSIGFRECASETARYMVAIEGMDLQDPLRLRLMSHLQCYAAQRELALKSSSQTVWNPSAFTTPHQFSVTGPHPPPLGPPPPPTESLHSSIPVSSHYNSHLSSTNSGALGDSSSLGLQSSSHMMAPPLFPKSGASPPPPLPPTSSYSTSGIPSQVGGNGHPHPSHPYPHPHHQYFTPGYGAPPVPGQHQSTSGKHYRPWGAELAY